ncbi:hypothetical protein [Polaromonas sp. CG_9.11]|uniref:hypothetical protein n=1 Tax=Polaromonas sp. CG_9.11 TaxID=2787730 RepID=UPI0018CA57F7|nr:hypothetical protein [Polaromonas sp. CG_9.11]MBG6077680.1 hypothetical protein [Polaromonas sp. CG_9.11]
MNKIAIGKPSSRPVPDGKAQAGCIRQARRAGSPSITLRASRFQAVPALGAMRFSMPQNELAAEKRSSRRI